MQYKLTLTRKRTQLHRTERTKVVVVVLIVVVHVTIVRIHVTRVVTTVLRGRPKEVTPQQQEEYKYSLIVLQQKRINKQHIIACGAPFQKELHFNNLSR